MKNNFLNLSYLKKYLESGFISYLRRVKCVAYLQTVTSFSNVEIDPHRLGLWLAYLTTICNFPRRLNNDMRISFEAISREETIKKEVTLW